MKAHLRQETLDLEPVRKAGPQCKALRPPFQNRDLIANGDVEIGFQQLSELLDEPGINIVCVLPDALLPITTFSIGVCRATDNADAVSDLIEFLLSPQANSIKKRYGME